MTCSDNAKRIESIWNIQEDFVEDFKIALKFYSEHKFMCNGTLSQCPKKPLQMEHSCSLMKQAEFIILLNWWPAYIKKLLMEFVYKFHIPSTRRIFTSLQLGLFNRKGNKAQKLVLGNEFMSSCTESLWGEQLTEQL